MALEQLKDTLTAFNLKVDKLETGRKALEEMASFLNNPELDQDAKALFVSKLIEGVPEFVQSYDVLLASLGLPTNGGANP